MERTIDPHHVPDAVQTELKQPFKKVLVCWYSGVTVAVQIVIRLIMAWFAIGVLMYIMMPTIYTVAYTLPSWQTMPASLLAIRDNLYGVFLISGIVAFAVSIIWGFSASTRQDVYDTSEI